MKIVSVSQDYFDLVNGDRELMLKRDRPCIVVVRLRFRGKCIVSECQACLDLYEREGRPRFAVDIDRIVGLLEGKK